MTAVIARVRDVLLYRGVDHLLVEGGHIVRIAALLAIGACGLMLTGGQ